MRILDAREYSLSVEGEEDLYIEFSKLNTRFRGWIWQTQFGVNLSITDDVDKSLEWEFYRVTNWELA